MPRTERGNATVGGLKEVVRIAERMTECSVRLTGVFQVSGRSSINLTRQIPLDLQHAA